MEKLHKVRLIHYLGLFFFSNSPGNLEWGTSRMDLRTGQNNYTHKSEISTLQGQHDSLEQRVDTIESKLGTSFENVAIRHGAMGVSVSNVDSALSGLKVSLGTSFGNIETLLGTSINDNTNRIDNTIGVSLYNIDSWKGILVGSTIPLCRQYKQPWNLRG